jgi:hypothetical protein
LSYKKIVPRRMFYLSVIKKSSSMLSYFHFTHFYTSLLSVFTSVIPIATNLFYADLQLGFSILRL